MTVIGITGPSGSGKSVIARMLTEYGYEHIDADAVYHNLLIPPSECLDELTRTFGEGILNAGGMLDRKKLAAMVFAEGAEHKLETLNRITHKYVHAKISLIMRHYEINGAVGCTIDAPLLIEAGIDSDCDFVISVLADPEVRAERICARDSISMEAAMARISSQKSDDFYVNRSHRVIYNNGDVDSVRADVESILARLGGAL